MVTLKIVNLKMSEFFPFYKVVGGFLAYYYYANSRDFFLYVNFFKLLLERAF